MKEIIAEAGVAWHDLREAEKLIEKAAEVGCNAIKFQLYDDEAIDQADKKWKRHLAKCQLSNIEALRLKKTADFAKIELFFTPMYREAVKLCEELGVKRYKIREKDSMNDVLLLAVRKTDKPVYVSRNGWPFKQRNFYTVYVDKNRPTQFNQIQWYGTTPQFRHKEPKASDAHRINCWDLHHWEPVNGQPSMLYYDGYSCHCEKLLAPIIAMHFVDYIEVHVTLDTTDTTLPDNKFSFGFTDVYEMCRWRDVLNARRPEGNRPKFELT